jgi:hypothetical protein
VIQRFLNLLFRVFVILQLAGQVGVISGHIKVAVTTKEEEKGFGFTRFTAPNGLINGSLNGMGGLGGWDDTLGAGKFDRCFEDGHLVFRLGFNQSQSM